MLVREFTKGIIKENALFVSLLGLCPTLAVTTSVQNGIAMGAAVIVVITCSNVIVSLIRRGVPSGVRIPCYIVVIATFVTLTELYMKAFFPPKVAGALGVFLPLIVVNCIIFFRAEAFASKNGPLASLMDGLGTGVGFGLALIMVSVIREVVGSGTLMGLKVSTVYKPVAALSMAPGAFLVIGLLIAMFNYIGQRRKERA